MIVGGSKVVFQVDPGETFNMLPIYYADKIVPQKHNLWMWNDSQCYIVGTRRTSVRNPWNNKKYYIEFQVYEGDYVPILGLTASEVMGLVTVQDNNSECQRCR